MALLAANGKPLINPNNYIEATDEQLAYIRSVYEIFQGILSESELFPDGLPDMTFAVDKKIRKR